MKNLIYGLVTVAVALGASAFTQMSDNSIPTAKRAGAITANFLTQPNVDVFNQLPSGTPTAGDCDLTSQRHCYYSVTPTGKDSIPNLSSYDRSQIDTYVTKGWIVPGSGSQANKLYRP
jgi:hypothetical protein